MTMRVSLRCSVFPTDGWFSVCKETKQYMSCESESLTKGGSNLRCEHAGFCVEVFMCHYIHFYSFTPINPSLFVYLFFVFVFHLATIMRPCYLS